MTDYTSLEPTYSCETAEELFGEYETQLSLPIRVKLPKNFSVNTKHSVTTVTFLFSGVLLHISIHPIVRISVKRFLLQSGSKT